MVHSTAVRLIARRALRSAARRAVQSRIELKTRAGKLEEARLNIAKGVSASVSFPETADSLGDLPI